MPVNLHATPDQIGAILCPSRYIGVFAGRRYGKTKGILVPRAIKRCMERPGSRVAYIAPTHKLTKEIFRTMLRVMRPHVRRSDAQIPFVIEFTTGSEIWFYSWKNPDSIRGSGYSEVQFDEIQSCRDEDVFWQVVRPLVSDRRGAVVVAGQFRGKNWFYKQFVQRAGRDYVNGVWTDCAATPNRSAFIFPASTGIMYQDAGGKADLLDAKLSLPRVVFEQEYECIPVANQAAVFHQDDLTASIRGHVLTAPRQGFKYIAGLDLGAHRDQGAIVILELPSATVVYAEALPIGKRHEELAGMVAPIVRRFRALPVVDVTGGATGGHEEYDAYVKFYRKALPEMRSFTWTRQNKQRAVRVLSSLIEQRKISIPAEHRQLHEELGLFEFTYKPWGYDYHGPKGTRDNLVAALSLCASGWDNGWVGTGRGLDLGSLLY